jgi:CheY-like chemotaxis protein
MSNQFDSFGNAAKSLARNPLGIIALFLVLVYGFASLVTGFAGSFSASERLPLIYFLTGFPVLVLGVFSWLVSMHHEKLYGPGDFKNEDNWVRVQGRAIAALSAAAAKREDGSSDAELDRIVNVVRAAGPANVAARNSWKNHILWVDDRPENNTYERQAFEALGLRFTLAESTSEAFERLAQNKFAAIISDMGRREGQREGYVLLDRLRKGGDHTPLIFYAASNAPEHKRETREHGGQGCTNNAQELFELVTRAVIERQTEAS